MQPEDRLIISVKETRKLLGKNYMQMTDEQVEQIIIQLDEIAASYFKDIKEGIIKIPSKE